MKIIGIIPARMASTRFPNKPMADIIGMPMIGHVYCRSKLSSVLDDVYVATCDKEIFDYITTLSGKAVMTSSCHERCSDRTAEALLKIEKESNTSVDIVVMIQGDEPMLRPEMIDQAIAPMLEDKNIKITNLVGSMQSDEEHDDPNEIKVVMKNNTDALYFSRSPIPSRKKYSGTVPMGKQICVIPFQRDFLIHYTALPVTPLEVVESIDMLRILEHGYNVRMVPTQYEVYSVDTAEDKAKVESFMKDDDFVQKYMK